MFEFEIVKNPNVITTRQEVYPSLADGVTVTASTANAEGSLTTLVAAATNTVHTLTVSHSCDSAGIVTINLDGINYAVTLATGSTGAVATQLRAANYGPWTVGGTGNDVTYTRSGKRSLTTFTDTGSTAVTASIVATTSGPGIGTDFQITGISASTISAVGTYQINLYKGASGSEERIGSVRFAQTSAAGETASGAIIPIPVKTPKLPAGTRISASLTSVAGGSETMKLALSYDA